MQGRGGNLPPVLKLPPAIKIDAARIGIETIFIEGLYDHKF